MLFYISKSLCFILLLVSITFFRFALLFQVDYTLCERYFFFKLWNKVELETCFTCYKMLKKLYIV